MNTNTQHTIFKAVNKQGNDESQIVKYASIQLFGAVIATLNRDFLQLKNIIK